MLIFDVCICPMLRIISPQKAAHNEILVKRIISPQKAARNEILVKRQQVNFRCVCFLSYVENYFSTKGCTQ